jgi:hypothetical protein
MNKLQEVKKHLHPGQMYRRAELMEWSKSVDRHLKQLLEKGTLTKLSGGLYYCPKKTVFGKTPAEERKLVAAFLKDDRFLLTSPNAYNSLGLGTTQLYNETVVYNHKRHGYFEFGGRVFDFRVSPHFPKKITKEFLLVDLMNNLDRLAEDTTSLHTRLKEKAASFNKKNLMKAVYQYGNLQSKKFFEKIFAKNQVIHAA